MTTENGKGAMIKALVKAQSEIKAVKKDRENPIAHSTYATLDAILEEVLPALNSNDLFMTQEPVSFEDEKGLNLGVRTTIWHSSGEHMEYEPFYMPIEANARMNLAQQAGSVITYAKRYAVSAIFGISTDEDKDGVQPSKEYNKEADKPLTEESAKEMKLTFGKHKGLTLEAVRKTDSDYLNWLYKGDKTDPNIKKAIKLISEAEKRRLDAEMKKEALEDAYDDYANN